MFGSRPSARHFEAAGRPGSELDPEPADVNSFIVGTSGELLDSGHADVVLGKSPSKDFTVMMLTIGPKVYACARHPVPSLRRISWTETPCEIVALPQPGPSNSIAIDQCLAW